MGRMQGKVVAITGAASGMGEAMARLFVGEGARVVCADRSGKQEALAKSLGETAVAVQADVSVSADVQNIIATAEERFGRLDVLCNNAGFGGGMKPLADFSEDHYQTVIATNLTGVFLGMKYGIPALLRAGGGAIVNTASTSGLNGHKWHGVYAAAKAGVIEMTKTAALDYGDQGIRINAICPGQAWTGLSGGSREVPVPPAGARLPYPVALGRWGLPGDIAEAALFLASDAAAYITGVALPVDGGMSAAVGPAHALPMKP